MGKGTTHTPPSAAEFECVLEDLGPILYRFAATLSSPVDADDLVQDALARAWDKRRSYDPARGTLRAWLLAIVADQARARWRRRWRDRVPDLQLTVDEPQARSELLIDLSRAISNLPARQRTAIVLRTFVDLDIRDVAKLMGCSEGTIKATLHQARANLSKSLGDSYAIH